MKYRVRMHLPTVLLMTCVLTGIAHAQTASELEAKFGKPDRTGYKVAPNVRLTVTYGDVADLLAEIKQQTDSPPWDRSAAQNLWNSCRQRGVETVSELMYFFNLKWQMIRLKRNTVNPVGLMTKAVPESISSEALLNLRHEIDGEDEPTPETDWALNGWQDRYQAVLDDPGASEQEKRIAATALSQNKYEGRGRSAYE